MMKENNDIFLAGGDPLLGQTNAQKSGFFNFFDFFRFFNLLPYVRLEFKVNLRVNPLSL